ncbi:MAG: CoA ester lyase [Anaerolineae bacterium]|nr:CoA ester lyase [Anaerolineae bacterium]
MMRVRRALLFMPGDSRRKIEKGAAGGVDSVIMDLEDGVAISQKDAARREIAQALGEVDFRRSEKLVRVNPAGSPLFADDLDAVLPARPEGIVLPKVESAEDVAVVDSRIRAEETAHGWTPDGIALIAIVETAMGVVNLREIAASVRDTPRLQALVFGAEDLAGDMGAVRTAEGWEGLYARGAVVLHAKAFGLDAIDTVHIDFNDEAGLTAQARRALEMGYTGKLAIHPRQVEPIQRAFTPSANEVAAARRLVEAHAAAQAAGIGAIQIDGRMIDMPLIRAAERVLARAGQG